MAEENDKLLTVSQVCKLTGATPAKLKNWDREGLLVAKRTGHDVANNRKLYSDDDVQLIHEILLYRRLGFGIDQIKEILAAPESERSVLVAARTNELKEDYALIQRQIELSKALEVIEPAALMDEFDGITNVDALVSAYEKNESLMQVLRWARSHTEQDVEQLSRELEGAFLGFAQLPQDADWKTIKLQIARFCDAWSKPFGWPTVGQMLVFSEVFQDLALDEENASKPFNIELSEKMATAFLLAWASGTLRCLEDILADFYWFADDDLSLECVQKAAKVLRALIAESGCHSHLADVELSEEQAKEFVKISDEVFDLLEDVALDENLGRYLCLDELYAIDGPALETAKQLVEAHVGGSLNRWLIESGREQIERRIGEWAEALNLRFEWILFEEQGSGIKDWHERTSDEKYARSFCSWIEDHYACAFANPPEARWASEEEQCLVEKMTREYVQQMDAEAEAEAEAEAYTGIERVTVSYSLEFDE